MKNHSLFKRLLACLVACVMLLGFVACTTEGPGEGGSTAAASAGGEAVTPVGDGESLLIGFSLPSLNFPFYVRMYDTFVEECETRGWDYVFADGNLDSGIQLNGVNDLINRNIDVLVMATWWIDAMLDIFDQCEAKGIPVFLMDNMDIPAGAENAITFTTGTDNYNAGYVGGTWYAGELLAAGVSEINLITVAKMAEKPMQRGYGFHDALVDGGISVTLLQEYDAGERAKAMAAIEDALVTYPQVELIYGTSAQDSLGAYDACVGANKPDIVIFGFDGEDDEIELIDGGTQYVATITQDPVGMSRIVAENVAIVVGGGSVDQVLETPAGVYCATGQLEGADILAG